VREARTAQFLLTLAEDNPALAQLVAGRADVGRLLLELTAAVPGSDQGDRLYLRVVGAGTNRKSPRRPRGPPCLMPHPARAETPRDPVGVLLALRESIKTAVGTDPAMVALPVLNVALRQDAVALAAQVRATLRMIDPTEPVRLSEPAAAGRQGQR